MISRYFLLLTLLFCTASIAQAQLSVGISGGATRTNWEWDIKTLDLDIGLGPAIGWRTAAVADWRLSAILGLRAELGYQVFSNCRKVIFTYPNDPEGTEGTFREYYHAWTGSLLVNITPFRQKKVYFLAGTSAAALAKGWSRVSKNLRGPSSPERTEIDLENYNRTQYFADFGAGVRFPIKTKGSLFTELRYQAGLSNLASVPTVDARMNSICLNVGYLFHL